MSIQHIFGSIPSNRGSREPFRECDVHRQTTHKATFHFKTKEAAKSPNEGSVKNCASLLYKNTTIKMFNFKRNFDLKIRGK